MRTSRHTRSAGDPATRSLCRRRSVISILVASALFVGGAIAEAAVTGTLYGRGGRVTTLATYANDFALAASSAPLEVAFDGTSMWTANIGTNGVTKIGPNGGVTNFPVGSGAKPRDIAFDGTNMWTANSGTDSVSKVQPGGTVTTFALPTGSSPRGIAFDGTNMWTANNDDTVSKITAGGTVTTYPLTAGSAPTDIAFDGTYMWTANAGFGNEGVSQVRLTDGQVTATYGLASGSSPQAIVFDGIDLWTANSGTDDVSQITVLGTIVSYPLPVGSQPTGIALDQPGYSASGPIDAGLYLWTANSGNDTISKIEVDSGSVVATYPVGYMPQALGFDGTYMWVVQARLNPMNPSISTTASIARIRVR